MRTNKTEIDFQGISNEISIVGSAKLNGKCGQTKPEIDFQGISNEISIVGSAKLNGKCGQT